MLRLWRSDAMLKHSDVARFTRSDAMFANKHVRSTHHARSAHHLWNKHHVSQRGTHHSATEKAPFLNCIKNGAFSIGGSGGIRTHEPLRTTAFRVFFTEVKNRCFRANSGFLVCAENHVASGFWQFCPRLLAWIKWVQSKMRNFQKNANFWKNARKKARKQPFLGLKIPKYCKMARHHARHF